LPDAGWEPPDALQTPLTPLTPEEERALAEEVDLEADLRRQVLLIHRALDRLDHYALLHVERTADRKVVKRAYYDLAAKFHPDKYFRKKLGSFKARMEAVFGRLTLAHDTLTDKTRRSEYDAYLEEQRRSRGIEELLADALAEAKRAEERIEREAREQATRDAAARAGNAAAANVASAPSPKVEDAARREALARRLLGGRAPPRSSSSGSATPAAAQPVRPAVPSVPSTAEAMDALRRRYEERVSQAKGAQARKYITNGEAALASGDAIAAANAFRVALTLSPDNADLQRTAQEAQQRADAILAETYAKQGAYEERNGQWVESARSWMRVARARPTDPTALERAANAIVKSEGDLHEARRLGQEACRLEPANPALRVTLANVYLAAGLALNARRELETAAQLAPHDGTIQAILRRVGKP
jgi:curved DNA-binding protein CbpA